MQSKSMEKADRYRFYPTTEQASLLRRTMGGGRLVFNLAWAAARTEAWHAKQERLNYVQTSNKVIGLDAGITSSIATSNGEKTTNPKHFQRLHKKLSSLQKAWSRKQKGSNNRHKVGLKVARVRGQITNVRQDFLQKLTTQLVRENQTIVVEDLAVKNMVKNHQLAEAINDASWGELIRQLAYKCQWYDRELVKIDLWFPSSKRGGNCGYMKEGETQIAMFGNPCAIAPGCISTSC